jgi:hypothetical protein
MQKIILLILSIFIINISIAQTDTSKYFRDTIFPMKSFFINQPLSKLLDTLKYKVQIETISIKGKKGKDSVPISGLGLYFRFYIDDRLTDFTNTNYGVILRVIFTQPIIVPMHYIYNSSLLGSRSWNAYKQLFYGQYIISDFKLSGL